MIRIILIFVVGYVCYRALKSWMQPITTASRPAAVNSAKQDEDVMIKDPFCEAYFPKRNAVNLNLDGKDLHFCSAECRDNYLATLSENEK
jgi:YHS domain-containing protein